MQASVAKRSEHTQPENKAAEQLLRALHCTGRRIRVLDKPGQKPLTSQNLSSSVGMQIRNK